MHRPSLSAIHIYPVKSCAGIALERAQVDRWGLQWDRHWMVVDANGTFVSQREAPALAGVTPRLSRDALQLSRAGAIELELQLGGAGPPRRAKVWGHQTSALDQGEQAAAWFSDLLGAPHRLVRIPPEFERRVNPRRYGGEAHTAFSDGYPLLLLTEASLQDLNERLPSPLPMNRFRPNLVVRGATAYAEDAWHELRIGARRFRFAKPCERCAVTTVDQQTGVRDRSGEPLRTLAGYRRGPKGAVFGVNLVHLDEGEIRVGSEVEIIEPASPRPDPDQPVRAD